MDALIIALTALGSYLFGCVNFAAIISKFKKKDIRSLDSGNPGAMNMLRNFGIKLGLLTLVLDMLKGAIPCIIGWYLIGGIGFSSGGAVVFNGFFLTGGNRLGLYIAAFSVIIGHVFPVFSKFKGGKGIASAVGICLVAQPALAGVMLAVGIVFIIFSHLGSLGSFIIISGPLGAEGFLISQNALSAEVIAGLVLIFLLFMLTVFTHRKNVLRLFSGNENKTVLFGKNKSAKKSAAEKT